MSEIKKQHFQNFSEKWPDLQKRVLQNKSKHSYQSQSYQTAFQDVFARWYLYLKQEFKLYFSLEI